MYSDNQPLCHILGSRKGLPVWLRPGSFAPGVTGVAGCGCLRGIGDPGEVTVPGLVDSGFGEAAMALPPADKTGHPVSLAGVAAADWTDERLEHAARVAFTRWRNSVMVSHVGTKLSSVVLVACAGAVAAP